MSDTQQATAGDTVTVHYTGKTKKQEQVFASSIGKKPVTFELGTDTVLEPFAKAVEGLEPGDGKQVTIPSDHAYGPYRQDLVFQMKRDQLNSVREPKVGDRIRMQDQASGETYEVRVVKVEGDTVTLDANHALAGKDLVFTIQLLAVDPQDAGSETNKES